MRPYITPVGISPEVMKKKRKALGLTQKEFADLIGVSRPTVERWETADKEITGPVVLLLELLTPEYLNSNRIPEKTLPIRLWYMYKEKACTIIDVDDRKQLVRIKNFTKNRQFRAFGVNEEPDYEDYQEFLESRCFPASRDKMKLILRDLNLPFYDPFMIIERTQGRMAEDDFWIKVER